MGLQAQEGNLVREYTVVSQISAEATPQDGNVHSEKEVEFEYEADVEWTCSIYCLLDFRLFKR